MTRRILANLLAEEELARTHRRAPPSRSVLATASRMALLLRVFAREGDHLWLPGTVDPALLPAIPGGPQPILESGPLRGLPPADEVLAWCETPTAMAHRGGARAGPGRSPGTRRCTISSGSCRPPPPRSSPRFTTAAFISRSRRRSAAPYRALGGWSPSRTSTARSTAVRQSWVVKAPFSASGRSRYIERNGPGLIDPKARRTVERLFAYHGALYFEPWMERTEDFGVSALLADGADAELRIVGIHRQRVDRKGQFEGIDLDAGLSAQDRDRLLQTVEAVAAALRREGYAGPFGIDAWRYRRADGALILNPLGEINARMTFGLVAWTAAGRAG